MSTVATIPPSVTNLFVETLQVLTKCSKMFIDAYDERRINLDSQVIPAGLSLVSSITQRAGQLEEQERVDFFRHLIDDGPRLCKQLIIETERRTPPTLTGDRLRAFLLKEDQGAGV